MLSYNIKKQYDHSLIFFPFAGGSGELYTPWFQYFAHNIDCRYAMLKGRGKYFHQNAFDKVDNLVNDIIPEILDVCDKPFSLFGHSMGALIAFELSRALQERFGVIPINLFVSGFRPPRLPHNKEFLHTMPKDQLIDKLYEMGGIQSSHTVNTEDLEPFLPTLYSDFKLCELYTYKYSQPLSCNIVVLWGDQDDFIQQDKISLWQKETCYQVEFKKFRGNHFYIWENMLDITSVINQKINDTL